jgi:hypothetical protein
MPDLVVFELMGDLAIATGRGSVVESRIEQSIHFGSAIEE